MKAEGARTEHNCWRHLPPSTLYIDWDWINFWISCDSSKPQTYHRFFSRLQYISHIKLKYKTFIPSLIQQKVKFWYYSKEDHQLSPVPLYHISHKGKTLWLDIGNHIPLNCIQTFKSIQLTVEEAGNWQVFSRQEERVSIGFLVIYWADFYSTNIFRTARVLTALIRN